MAPCLTPLQRKQPSSAQPLYSTSAVANRCNTGHLIRGASCGKRRCITLRVQRQRPRKRCDDGNQKLPQNCVVSNTRSTCQRLRKIKQHVKRRPKGEKRRCAAGDGAGGGGGCDSEKSAMLKIRNCLKTVPCPMHRARARVFAKESNLRSGGRSGRSGDASLQKKKLAGEKKELRHRERTAMPNPNNVVVCPMRQGRLRKSRS